MLFDLGPDDTLFENANKENIDLSEISGFGKNRSFFIVTCAMDKQYYVVENHILEERCFNCRKF